MTENYILKTYAGWLGKVIGIRLGAPIEGWSKEKIQLFYGNEFKDYVVDYKDFAADDDSNGPLFFVRALEFFNEITPQNMGKIFLNYIPKEHGFFWWGKELSTEHIAYNNLLSGLEGPQSGSAINNGKTMAEQIGGQIFIDAFGFVAPGNPQLGADLAEASARVTHDLDGVDGGRFIAACISLAYEKNNIEEILEEGLELINKEGTYYKVVKSILEIYNSGKTLEYAFEFLRKEFWTDKYEGICHIIPNAGIIAISLLYGKGSFERTMEIVNLLGFDTDCNAGNVGAIIGVMSGTYEDDKEKGIPRHLILPIQDIMIASSVVGSLNISTVSENTLLFCKLGYKLANQEMPSPYKELWYELENQGRRIANFKFTDALNGFRIKGLYKNPEVSIKNEKALDEKDNRHLKIMINNLHPNNKVEIYQNTFYEAKDLHDARYEPCFSPIAYSGDKVSCRVKNITGQKLKISLFSYNMISDKKEIFAVADLKESFKKDSYFQVEGRIPFEKNSIIKAVGIEVELLEEEDLYFGEQVVLHLDSFEIENNPELEIEFAKLYFDDYSIHSAKQKELIGFTHYQANTDGITIGEDSLKLSLEEKIYTGDYYWKNYDYTLAFKLGKKSRFDFLIRSQGIVNSYIVRISSNNLELILNDSNKETILASKEIMLQENKKYLLEGSIFEDEITLKIEDYQLTGKSKKIKNGMIGIQVKGNSFVDLYNLQIKGR